MPRSQKTLPAVANADLLAVCNRNVEVQGGMAFAEGQDAAIADDDEPCSLPDRNIDKQLGGKFGTYAAGIANRQRNRRQLIISRRHRQGSPLLRNWMLDRTTAFCIQYVEYSWRPVKTKSEDET